MTKLHGLEFENYSEIAVECEGNTKISQILRNSVSLKKIWLLKTTRFFQNWQKLTNLPYKTIGFFKDVFLSPKFKWTFFEKSEKF